MANVLSGENINYHHEGLDTAAAGSWHEQFHRNGRPPPEAALLIQLSSSKRHRTKVTLIYSTLLQNV